MTYKNLDSFGYEETVYEGNFKNHKREGYGVMLWRNGKEEFRG